MKPYKTINLKRLEGDQRLQKMSYAVAHVPIQCFYIGNIKLLNSCKFA